MGGIPVALSRVADLVEARLPALLALRHTITWKPDGSPVTDADLMVEAEVSAALVDLVGPVQLISEERHVSGTAVGRGWIAVLDPIDGTENFCSGLPIWGVSLALYCDGAHQGSLIALPELGVRMHTGLIVTTPFSRMTGLSSTHARAVGQHIGAFSEPRIMGSAVFNLYNVVRGSFQRFINPVGAECWDILAGVNLALEAGCAVYINGEQYDGQFLGPDQRYRVDIHHRYNSYTG